MRDFDKENKSEGNQQTEAGLLRESELQQRLVAVGYLIPSSIGGVVGLGAPFSDLVERLAATIHTRFGDGAQSMRFPPVMPRADLERIGYFRSFPHLLGLVSCFCGGEQEHERLMRVHDGSRNWTVRHRATNLALTPAACYPVYPFLARRGLVPLEGYTIEVRSHCFRRETPSEPTRLQSFEMLEFVRIGQADQVLQFRTEWIDRAQDFFTRLSLPFRVEPASDPFFGRTATIMKRAQWQQELKFELLVPINGGGAPTACMSFNYHQSHFGKAFSMRAGTSSAQSACVGFGLARIVLALLKWHGLSLSDWPASALETLGIVP